MDSINMVHAYNCYLLNSSCMHAPILLAFSICGSHVCSQDSCITRLALPL